jgi:hypothetical protein
MPVNKPDTTMRKTIFISATAISFVLMGVGAYVYFYLRAPQSVQPQPVVSARMICSPSADFGTLTEFEPDLRELIGAIRQNPLIDSLYNNTEFILEWHYNTDNNKNIPVLWFLQAGLEPRLAKEFPQKLSNNQVVSEVVDDTGRRIFFRVFPNFVLFSVSAEMLEKVPVNLQTPPVENRFTQSQTAFPVALSKRILLSIERKQNLLPLFSSFYLPFDSVGGILNTENNNILFRFFTSNANGQIDVWNQVASISNGFANYIPWGVTTFEAFCFADFSLFFNRMRAIPERKAAVEKYADQYQSLPSDSLSKLIGNWIWSANLDITERGEYTPIAGIQIADTLKMSRLLSTICIPMPGEQLKVPGSKEVVRIQQLVTGNFFEHVFPSATMQSDTVFVMLHRNHLWLATSPKILRYTWGTYINKFVLGNYLELNRATWFHYTNVKKLRAALAPTDNSQQAMFLRSFYQTHNQAEHCLLEIDFSVKPGGGIFRIW